MRKINYLLLALFILVVVGAGAYAYLRQPKATPSNTNTSSKVTASVQLNTVGANAFGNFDVSQQVPKVTPSSTTRPTGSTSTESLKVSDSGSGSAPAIARPMEAKVYEYAYVGDTFTVPTIPVLKHASTLPLAQLQQLVSTLNLGMIDVAKFKNMQVQQITLAEDKDKGYLVMIDAHEGAISVYQNWERWATPTVLKDMIVSSDAGTVTLNNVNAAPLPADATVIDVANNFLTAHGINREAYGAPVVPKTFLPYGTMTPAIDYGSVQFMQVVYPLRIQGTPVVNDNGTPVGLTVDVDTNVDVVIGVSNLTSLQYDASSYSLITDAAKILDVAKRGGMYGGTDTGIAGATKVRVELGTPTVAYYPSRYQLEQTNVEYLIPALVFPIAKAPIGEPLYRTAIVVPLVDTVLNPQPIAVPLGVSKSAR